MKNSSHLQTCGRYALGTSNTCSYTTMSVYMTMTRPICTTRQQTRRVEEFVKEFDHMKALVKGSILLSLVRKSFSSLWNPSQQCRQKRVAIGIVCSPFLVDIYKQYGLNSMEVMSSRLATRHFWRYTSRYTKIMTAKSG